MTSIQEKSRTNIRTLYIKVKGDDLSEKSNLRWRTPLQATGYVCASVLDII